MSAAKNFDGIEDWVTSLCDLKSTECLKQLTRTLEDQITICHIPSEIYNHGIEFCKSLDSSLGNWFERSFVDQDADGEPAFQEPLKIQKPATQGSNRCSPFSHIVVTQSKPAKKAKRPSTKKLTAKAKVAPAKNPLSSKNVYPTKRYLVKIHAFDLLAMRTSNHPGLLRILTL